MTDLSSIVTGILKMLPQAPELHKRDHPTFILLDHIVRNYFQSLIDDELCVFPYEGMIWPYHDLGRLNSRDFFGLDEIVLHLYYYANRQHYSTAMDIGANIGIDAMILAKLGYKVIAYEPDPDLFAVLSKNMAINQVEIDARPYAISDEDGTCAFRRVAGNVTANHIEGARDYFGESELINVAMVNAASLMDCPDLVKINVEGHEKIIVKSLPDLFWQHADAFIEIHDPINAAEIYNFFKDKDHYIFAQKLGWQCVHDISDMPISNKEGYVFISLKDHMNWEI